MNSNEEQFTPEAVDEQIHQLTQVQHDQSSTTPGTRLIRELHSMHQEDARIAQRVWNRLETYAALRERIAERKQPVDMRGSQLERNRSVSNTALNSPTRGSIQQRLGILAATLFLVILVGSMIFVLNTAHQSKITHQTHHGQTGIGSSSSTQSLDQAGLYATLHDGVYRLDPASGKVRWHYSITRGDEYSNTALTVVKGGVYFGANDQNGHYLYALNASNGSLLWRKTLDYAIDNKPLVINNVVYVGTIMGTANSVDGGHIYALNASNGSIRWSYRTRYAAYVGPVHDGIVYGSSGDLFALNASDGKLRWSAQSGTGQGIGESQLVDGILYTASCEGSNHGLPGLPDTQYCYQYAFDPVSGKQLWHSQPVNGYVLAQATIVGGTIYFSSQNGNVYALDAKDGTQRWSHYAGGPVYLSPQIAHGLVYVINIKGGVTDRFIALDAATGNQLWSKPVNYNDGCDGQAEGSILVSGNLIYCGSGNRVVHVLRTSNGSLVESYQINKEKYEFETPVLLLVQ